MSIEYTISIAVALVVATAVWAVVMLLLTNQQPMDLTPRREPVPRRDGLHWCAGCDTLRLGTAMDWTPEHSLRCTTCRGVYDDPADFTDHGVGTTPEEGTAP